MEQCWIFEQLLRKHQKKLSFGSHYDLIHVSQGLLEGRVDPNGLVVRVAVGQLVDVPLEYVRQHALAHDGNVGATMSIENAADSVCLAAVVEFFHDDGVFHSLPPSLYLACCTLESKVAGDCLYLCREHLELCFRRQLPHTLQLLKIL